MMAQTSRHDVELVVRTESVKLRMVQLPSRTVMYCRFCIQPIHRHRITPRLNAISTSRQGVCFES